MRAGAGKVRVREHRSRPSGAQSNPQFRNNAGSNWRFPSSGEPALSAPDPVILWWTLLSAAAVMNMAAWAGAFIGLRRRRTVMHPWAFDVRQRLAFLSAIYVLGCAFRSFLPMVDVPRICLADPVFASIAVGRSVATFAELCFAAQWALLLREAALFADARPALLASRLLLPMIALAELSSWHAVLTTNYFSHLVENSLWTLAAFIVLVSFASLWTKLPAAHRRWFAAFALGALAYIGFMLTVDLPMYYQRWQADALSGQTYLSLSEGAAQILDRCTVERTWAAWRAEVAWLTLYFTVAVWSSIALMHYPALLSNERKGQATAG